MKNITVLGNIVKDAEMRQAGGTNVAGFSVAVNGYANREKTVTYFDVSIWGKRGESVMQFATKGAKICITGDLGTREHNGKTYLTINANDFTPAGGGQGNNDNQGGQSYGGGGSYGGGPDAPVNNGGTYSSGAAGNISDDEIPF